MQLSLNLTWHDFEPNVSWAQQLISWSEGTSAVYCLNAKTFFGTGFKQAESFVDVSTRIRSRASWSKHWQGFQLISKPSSYHRCWSTWLKISSWQVDSSDSCMKTSPSRVPAHLITYKFSSFISISHEDTHQCSFSKLATRHGQQSQHTFMKLTLSRPSLSAYDRAFFSWYSQMFRPTISMPRKALPILFAGPPTPHPKSCNGSGWE